MIINVKNHKYNFIYTHYKERYETIFAPGIKMFNNGIALKLDTAQHCSNHCNFCLGSEYRESVLRRNGIIPNQKVARIFDIEGFARHLDKAYQNKRTSTPFMDWALRGKYFIEVGTTGETFQESDLVFHTAYNFMKICSDYHIPLFFNTKLNLICRDDNYKKLLIHHKAPIIICASFTTTDDKDGKIYEPLAPLPSERLKVLKELSQYEHIKIVFYISPFIPTVTDKDTDKYVADMMSVGTIGAHLRDFFIQGNIRQKPIWKKYIENNKGVLEPFPGGYHVGYQAKKDFYFKVSELGKVYNPQFEIVGMKSKWFELNPYHGKMCYDYLPQSFKEGIVDFTALPILRKIRENVDKPQVLYYSNLGYDISKIRAPKSIRTNEGNINNLMDCGSNCSTPDVQYELTGEEWIRGSLWNGWEENEVGGFLSELDGIYPVKKGKDLIKDKEGNYVYVYIPNTNLELVKSENNQDFLFTPDNSKHHDNPYVREEDLKGMLIPQRKGDTSDKFLVS